MQHVSTLTPQKAALLGLGVGALVAAGYNFFCSKKSTTAGTSVGKNDDKVCVGVGCLVVCDGKFIIGRRKGKKGNGDDQWALPGGWLEIGETFAQTASRELEEECGLTIPPQQFETCFLTNNTDPHTRHTVTVFQRCEISKDDLIEQATTRTDGGIAAASTNFQTLPEPRNMEPHKCHGWTWFDFHKVAGTENGFAGLCGDADVFFPLRVFVDSMKKSLLCRNIATNVEPGFYRNGLASE